MTAAVAQAVGSWMLLSIPGLGTCCCAGNTLQGRLNGVPFPGTPSHLESLSRDSPPVRSLEFCAALKCAEAVPGDSKAGM